MPLQKVACGQKECNHGGYTMKQNTRFKSCFVLLRSKYSDVCVRCPSETTLFGDFNVLL